MSEDSRCCGTGTCLIDANGRCWCGQQWDGEHMCRPTSESGESDTGTTKLAQRAPAADAD